MRKDEVGALVWLWHQTKTDDMACIQEGWGNSIQFRALAQGLQYSVKDTKDSYQARNRPFR